jgi:hypothetical protein
MNQLNVKAVGVHGQVGEADLAEELSHGVVEPGEIPHVEYDALLVELEIRDVDRYGYSHLQASIRQASRQRPADGSSSCE